MDLKSALKSAVESEYGRDYMDYPTTLDEAIEIVREFVGELLDEIEQELS